MRYSSIRLFTRILIFCFVLMAATYAQTSPAIGGAWTSAGRPTTISQDANGRLVFTNENGLKSAGVFANATTVIATDWEGGLRGTLQDSGNTIRWANGTAWFRSASTVLAGAWTSAGRPTTISQDANGRLVFTNENGLKSAGTFANATTVIATDWEGGLRGVLQDNGNTIRWANGTAWFRSASTVLAGAWTSAGRPTTISQDANGRLVFTNENGLKSGGTFANATTVIATDWEGGLRGTLQDNGNTIRWANGTAWFRAAGAPKQELGTTLVVIYPNVCTAIWTRTQPGVYDSVTVCQGPGNTSFRETLTVERNDGQTVIIKRPGYGQFRGALSADRRTLRGSCDWAACTANYRWTAYIDWNWNDTPPLR